MKKFVFICCLIVLITGCTNSEDNIKNIEIDTSAYTTMNILGTEIDTSEFVDSIEQYGLTDSTFEDLEEYINEEINGRIGEMIDQCDGLSGDELRECFWDKSKQ